MHVFIPDLICFPYFGNVVSKIDKQLKRWMKTLIISCHWVLGLGLGAIISLKVKHGDKGKSHFSTSQQKTEQNGTHSTDSPAL